MSGWLRSLMARLPGATIPADDADWGAPLPPKWSFAATVTRQIGGERWERRVTLAHPPETTRLLKLDGQEFRVARASSTTVECVPEPASLAARRAAERAGWRRRG